MEVSIEKVVRHLKEQVAQLSYDNALLKAQVDTLQEQQNSGNQENVTQK